MDQIRIGKLICSLRKEKQMTQKQLAEQLFVSEQAVSKWERGLGCPEVASLSEVAKVLGVSLETLLSGNRIEKDPDSGNMKKLRFYVCKECGNLITSTSEMDAACCGKKLTQLQPMKCDESHQIKVELIDGDFYISMEHEMTKQHYITMFAYVTCSKVNVTKLYPEQEALTNYRKNGHGILYAYCKEHGLYYRYI